MAVNKPLKCRFHEGNILRALTLCSLSSTLKHLRMTDLRMAFAPENTPAAIHGWLNQREVFYNITQLCANSILMRVHPMYVACVSLILPELRDSYTFVCKFNSSFLFHIKWGLCWRTTNHYKYFVVHIQV